MFSAFNEICTTDVDDMGKSFSRVDDQIVVFDHLELTELFSASRFIKDTFVNSLER